MRRILLILAIVICGVYATASAAEFSEEVIIARVNEWPPFYYQENGAWKGTNIDLYQALAKEAGIKIEFKVIPWSRAMVDMHTMPIIIAQLAITEERKKIMHFIGPHSKEQMVIAIRKEHLNNEIKNLDDLADFAKKTGRQIAYQQDVFYSKEFNSRMNRDPEFSKSFEKKALYYTMIKMLESGRISGFLEEKSTLTYLLRNKHRNSIVTCHPFVLSSNDVFFGVSKTVSEKTLNKLYKANERLVAKGTYKKIMEKWTD